MTPFKLRMILMFSLLNMRENRLFLRNNEASWAHSRYVIYAVYIKPLNNFDEKYIWYEEGKFVFVYRILSRMPMCELDFMLFGKIEHHAKGVNPSIFLLAKLKWLLVFDRGGRRVLYASLEAKINDFML